MASLRRYILKTRDESDLFLLLTSPYFMQKKYLRDAIKEQASRVRGGLVLDVGCGWKPYRDHFPHAGGYIGLDLTASRRPDVVSTAERLPVLNEVADVVLCTEVVEHTAQPEAAFRELARVTKPGGMVLLSAPMTWNLHYEPHDYYRFTKYGLHHLMTEAGIEVMEVVRIGGLSSFVGVRIIDLLRAALGALPLYSRIPKRDVISTLGLAPLNAVFYLLARALDRIDTGDAIGWFMVGRKAARVDGVASTSPAP